MASLLFITKQLKLEKKIQFKTKKPHLSKDAACLYCNSTKIYIHAKKVNKKHYSKQTTYS